MLIGNLNKNFMIVSYIKILGIKLFGMMDQFTKFYWSFYHSDQRTRKVEGDSRSFREKSFGRGSQSFGHGLGRGKGFGRKHSHTLVLDL